jgi:caffeoyl-CoA O-methyltransferase
MSDLLAILTIVLWPVIPLFWIPVHLFPGFFRKLGYLTYLLPFVTWLPLAFLIYLKKDVLLHLRVDMPLSIQVTGGVLLLTGTLLHLWTGKLLGFRGLVGLPEVYSGQAGHLVTYGAFSIVRHPTYFAHTMMFSGVFLFTGSIAVGVITVLDLLIVHFLIIPIEEKELLSRFEGDFSIYRWRVPSFFPSPRGRRPRQSFVPERIERFVQDHTTPLPELLEELERETYETTENPGMLTGRVEGQLLQMLVRVSGARRVLEVGTFTGFSALMMAKGLPDDGEIITCEVEEKYAEIARSYFDRSPYSDRIRVMVGPAMESLARIHDGSIDFMFIDADKTSYLAYYEEGLRVLRSGGLIAVDNVLWRGRVLNPRDENSWALAGFDSFVREDSRVEKVMLAVRDGIYLIRKKEWRDAEEE